MPEKLYRTFTIAIKDEDSALFERTVNLLLKYLYAKRNIPYQLIEKLYTAITAPAEIEKEVYSEKSIEIADKAEIFFKGNPDYDFNGHTDKEIIVYRMPFEDESISAYENRIAAIPPLYEQYSLRDMCLLCTSNYFKKFALTNSKRATKRNAIRFLYKYIESYAERFNDVHKFNLTHYKKTVVSTFLANEIGVINPPLVELTNEKFYGQGKNAVKEYKPAK